MHFWGMERAAGIEPACLAWKARALPLSYARDFGKNPTVIPLLKQDFFGCFPELFWKTLKIEISLIIWEFELIFAVLQVAGVVQW